MMMKSRHDKMLAGLFGLLAVAGLTYLFFAPKGPLDTVPLPPTGPISVRGMMTCLPHRDTSGPQTMECAFGLRDEQGRYYALQDTDPNYGNVSGAPNDVTVTVHGKFRPQQDVRYQNIGTIEVTSIETDKKIYASMPLGIAFDYPDGYVLEERDLADGAKKRHVITLIRKEDAVPPVNGEGPTSINVDIHPGEAASQSLEDWLKKSKYSNFELSDGTFQKTSVAGQESLTYRWSGLYEGETTVFKHSDDIIAVSVTTLGPDDKNVRVYGELLGSISLR